MRIHEWLASLNHTLDKDSLVIDCGGYIGDYTAEILLRYGCKVILFEPCPTFYEQCRERFKDDKRVTVLSQGLGRENGFKKLYVNKDATSVFKDWAKSDEVFDVEIIKLSEFIKDKKIDCLKLNCEGSEYEIIDELYKSGKIRDINEILVQFHKIKGFNKKFQRQYLSETHELVFHYKWDLWKRKGLYDRANTPEYWNNMWSRKKRRVEKYCMQRALQKIRDSGAQSVLDVGCGNGKLLFMVKDLDCFGIDISDVAIKRMNDFYEVPGEAMDIYEMDIKIKRKFDFIVCNHTLEHLYRDEWTVRVCKEKLYDGGTFFCAVPNDISGPEETEEHVRKYDKKSLEALLMKVFGNAEMSILGHHIIGISKKC
jgi:FkbM family methyltransferase